MKRITAAVLAVILVLSFTSCGQSESEGGSDIVEIKVFAAASLNDIMQEFKEDFEAEHENVEILINADSSGTLMNQILEGAPCDLFFSAAQKQMDQLEEEGLIKEETRRNVVNNKLVVITQKDTETGCKGLSTLSDASSVAMADGSVPAGKYTRQALISLGILDERDDPAEYTTQEVSDALGGVEISEQGNVSKVLIAVEEASCEVGTTYLSDTYGHEEKIRIIEEVPYEITGNIIYPVSLVENKDASDEENALSEEFLEYITNEKAKERYREHLFDPDVE